MAKATPEQIERASKLYGDDDCVIDDDATISEVDEGVWVQAWVWLPNEEGDSANG